MKDLFRVNLNLNINRLVDTFSFHYYGKMSADFKIRPGDANIFDFLAASHCQLVYEHVKANGLLFE